MDLANILRTSSRLPWKIKQTQSMHATARVWGALGVLLFSAAFLGLLCQGVLQHGFVGQSATGLWTRILIVRDTTEFSPAYVALLFPPIPVVLSAVLSYLPGLGDGAAPYLVGVLATALLLAVMFFDLAPRHGLPFSALFTCLLGLNPAMIWVATTGANGALGLLVFYGLMRILARFNLARDPQDYLHFGCLLCLLFFVDERALYLALAIFPVLPLVMPERPLKLSPLSVYLVLFSPLILGLLSWMYLNWLFMHDTLGFLTAPDALLRGAFATATSNQWLRTHGGEFLFPLVAMLAGLLLVFPAWLSLPQVALRHGKFSAGFAATVTIVVAGAFGTMTLFVAHPLDMIVLGAVALMIGIKEMPLSIGRRRNIQILMAVGVCSGWLVFLFQPAPEMVSWREALSGQRVAYPDALEQALGQFLAEAPCPTLMDDHAAPYGVAARGSAKDLILPYSYAFKLAMASTPARVQQIAVSKPGSPSAQRDRITQRFPYLYQKGLPGYVMVFEQGDWRVWRRRS